MKQEKNNILIHNILLLLSENEYISVSRIASILASSESTIRRRVDTLNDVLKESGYGSIQKLPQKGLHLIVENSNAITKLYSSFELKNVTTGEQRIYKYLFILLSSKHNRITMNELGESVYDSRPVVRRNLKACEEWLEVFDLRLVIKKNYGISLIGSEENIRTAIKHLIINNDLQPLEESLSVFAKGLDLALVKKCIFIMKKEWNIKLAEESFHSMFIYASLAIVRSRYTKLNVSPSEREIIMKYDEYGWSKSLFEIMETKFSVNIDTDEIIYFSKRLLCSYFIHGVDTDENIAYKYDEKLKDFVANIIKVISDLLNVDLTPDSELYYGLLNHIRSAIFRMRFDKHTAKALGRYIKDEYKQMCRVSWALSILFEEHYGINISSTELSYIALYFQSSLERISTPVNMALITDLGMGVNQLICNKIKMAIPQVEKITIVSLHDFTKAMITHYDLIITTSDLDLESEKIIQSGSLMSDKEISEIKQKLKRLNKKRLETKVNFDPFCHELFDPRLIFTDISVDSKAKLLEMLAKQLESVGCVTTDYHNSILKREKTVSTYIGNGVAIPHGNSSLVIESKVAVAILKNPVMWDTEDKVDTVFLLAFKISNPIDSKRVQLFYKGFLDLIEPDHKLRYLRSLRGEELYKYLTQ